MLVVGVTGRRLSSALNLVVYFLLFQLKGSAIVGRYPVANLVAESTISRIKLTAADISLPSAKTSPVLPELIVIGGLSKNGQVGCPVQQARNFSIGKLSWSIVSESRDKYSIFGRRVVRELQRFSDLKIRMHDNQRGAGSAIHDFSSDDRVDIQSDALPYVGLADRNGRIGPKRYTWIDVTNLYPCALLGHRLRTGKLQLILHRYPLFLGIPDVKPSEQNNSDRSYSGDAPVMIVKESEHRSQWFPNCFKRPHYVLAFFCALAGILCLGLASGCWRIASESPGSNRASFGLLGFVPMACCFWFIYQSLSLAYFGVAPCASIWPAHMLVDGVAGRTKVRRSVYNSHGESLWTSEMIARDNLTIENHQGIFPQGSWHRTDLFEGGKKWGLVDVRILRQLENRRYIRQFAEQRE